jgi:hypothetical protein
VFLFDRAVARGQLPVRWVEGLQDGLGQPLFNHYQVGFYYIVELIHQLGASLSLSLNLAVAMIWICGGTFVFLWLTPLGVLPAALAASVFAWSPYLLLDGYVRAAYPELSAIAFTPGILWSLDRWLRGGRPLFLCALALTTAVVVVSHLPTALVMAPVCAAYAIVCWRSSGSSATRLGATVGGAALGAAMAAFYLIPAILELRHIKITRLTTAYFDYHRHFVRPSWWLDQGWTYNSSGVAAYHMSLQLGALQLALIVAALLVLTFPAVRHQAGKRLTGIAGWLIVAAGGLFMMTAPADPFWHLIKPLAYLQFPWRFLMLPALACSALAALLLSMVRSRTTQALIVIAAVTVQWYAMRDARGAIWLERPAAIGIDDPFWPASESGRRLGFHEVGYDPVSATGPLTATASRWAVVEGEGEVTAESIADSRLVLSVRASEPLRLAINSPFFPGWTIRVDGRPVEPTVQPGSGYMEILVPPGSHRVEARFGNTPVRTAANLVSLGALLIFAVLAVRSVRKVAYVERVMTSIPWRYGRRAEGTDTEPSRS